MYSTEKLKEMMFIGAPILLDDIFIHPITVKDKIKLGNQYGEYLNLLCLSNFDLESIFSEKGILEDISLKDITPFTYLLASAEANNDFLLKLKQAFSTFLREEVLIIPNLQIICVGKLKDQRIINQENFPDFQTILRLQNHLKVPEEVPENENYMQKKFRLRRKQLADAKAKQAQKSKDSPHFIDLMSSLCIMNVGITWQNIGEVPIFTFYELLGRSQNKEKYDTDVRALLAGADSKKIKLKYWVRDNSVDE